MMGVIKSDEVECTLPKVTRLKCPCCHAMLRDPKVLPCLHTFNRECLNKAVSDGVVACDVCKEKVTLDAIGGSVNELPGNFLCDNVLDMLTVCRNKGDSIQCDSCRARSSSYRCFSCSEFLCSGCRDAHSATTMTRDHSVVALEDIIARSDVHVQENFHRVIECQSHRGNSIKYFCTTCDVTVCSDCVLYQHKRHDFYSITDIFKCQRSEIAVQIMKVRKRIEPFDDSIANLVQLCDEVDDNAKTSESGIDSHIDACIAQLEQARLDLKSTVAEARNSKLKTLVFQLSALRKNVNILVDSCEFADSILNHGNEQEIMTVKSSVVKRLAHLLTLDPDLTPATAADIQYSVDPDKFLSGVGTSHLGMVHTIVAAPELSSMDAKLLENVDVGKLTTLLLRAFDTEKKPLIGYTNEITTAVRDVHGHEIPTFINDIGDGVYELLFKVKRPGSHIMNVSIGKQAIPGSPFAFIAKCSFDYSILGHSMTIFGHTGSSPGLFSKPMSISADPASGNLVVADTNNDRVQVFNSSGKLLRVIGQEGSIAKDLREPCGVSINDEGDVYVADSGNNRVCVYDASGALQQTIDLTPYGHRPPFSISSRDDKIVLSTGGGCIQILSSRGGSRRQCIKLKEYYWDEQQGVPYHVTISPRGHILVSNRDFNRVEVYDSEGEFVKCFGSKGSGDGEFEQPEGIAVDGNGSIVVCDHGNNRLQVFDYNGHHVTTLGGKGNKRVINIEHPTSVCMSPLGSIAVTSGVTNKVTIIN